MKLFITIAAAALIAGGMAEARDLRVSPGAPPAHPAFPMYENFGKYLSEATGGELGTTMIGVEVVNVGNMRQSLQSGVTEVGNILPLYSPAELPNTALLGDLASLGKNPYAMAAAATEYVATCADCQAEFKAAGMVYTGSGSSDPYFILTTKPVHSASDMAGLRLRSGGSPFSRFAEAMGAAPVAVSVTETFEQMSQGVIDGTMASINDLLAFRLVDLVKSVTTLKIGTYHCTANMTIAGSVWSDLSTEQRAAVIAAANKAGADFTQDWAYDRPAVAMKAAQEAGIEFIEPDAAMTAAYDAFLAAEPAAVVTYAADTYGIDDAEVKIARFQELIAKWEGIVAETGEDPVAVAARIQTEVWDKIDMSTYGM
jgi:TRAP-type C4-dicarboxylate transport system substrate-binding protein